jgi:hypothetical protein
MTKESEIEQRDVARCGWLDLWLGPKSNKNWGGGSNTCDFTIYRDARRMWHAIVRIRRPNAPGARVFHHWTSDSLTAEDWHPKG